MTDTITAGSILVEGGTLLPGSLLLRSESDSNGWAAFQDVRSTFERTIQAEGWNFFFMAAEVKVTFFGAIGANSIQNALRRLLEKVKPLSFNCLEVTGIVGKRFLGVPYTVVLAHSRHIQKSCYLDGNGLRTSQRDATRR